jgi:protocatechuate 3,4-dioxygenase beta subunit
VRVVATPALGLGAAVVAVSSWDTGAESIEARTDARGRFRLEGIAPGLQSLTAIAHGLGSARKNEVRPGSTVNLIARPGGWLAGRVTDPQGRPVAGALVRAELEPQFWTSSSVETTDADGRFEIAGLDPGTYTVMARHADFAAALAGGVAVTGEGRGDLAIVLTTGAAVSGRLVDNEGRPLAGRVNVQELAGQAVPRSLTDLLRADAADDGRFRVERLAPGSYALGAVAPRFSGRRVEAEVSGREPVVDVGDIVLEQGVAIRGRVRTVAGVPIADAEITTGSFDMVRGGAFSEARSGPDGTFVLAGLIPGPTQVNVRASGFASVNDKTLMAGDEPVDVILTPGGSIGGLVVEEANHPVDAYRIVVNPAKARHPFEGRVEKAVGSGDGRFLLEDLADETYVVQVLVPDRAPAVVPAVRVNAGRTTDAGIIRVPKGGVVRGTVTDAAGDPVVGATVKAYGTAQDVMEWRDQLQALSEGSGAFEIKGVPEGKRQIVATHPDFATADTMVDVASAKGPTETRLVMTQGGRIEGVARKRDGSPLAGLSILSFSPAKRGGGGSRPSNVTAADGTFTVEHVPAGLTSISLMASAGQGRMESMMSKQVEVREGETTSVDFTSRDILVTGHVTKSGAPLAGLRLRFMGESGMSFSMGAGFGSVAAAPTGPQRQVGTTAEDGAFALIVDSPGKYNLWTESADGRTHYPNRELQIPDAETHAVEIAFSGVPLAGVVLDKDTEQPIAQAAVSAALTGNSAAFVGSTQTTADGRFQLDADPGEYAVAARADGYAPGRVTATVGAAGVSDVRVDMEKGAEIKGRVVDASGQGVPSVEVRVSPAAGEGDATGSQALPDGSFRVTSLAARPYNLCAGNQLAGYAVLNGVSPGGPDVALTLRPASRIRVLVKGPDGVPLAKVWGGVSKVGGAPIDVPWMGGRNPTDATGLLEIPAPAGAVEISLSGEQFKGKATATVAAGATASTEVTLTEPIQKPN